MASAELAPECDSLSVVHVCPFSVGRHVERFASIAECLSPEERARAQCFLKEADRKRFILGRTIVRYLCGAYLRTKPASVRLDQTSTGKPYLSNPIPANRKRFEFNLAHSGDCVLVAWTEGQAVGVDVEALERYASALLNDVSAVAFSDAECVALAAAKPAEVAATFYRIWVRKEAVLKGEGCGIGGSLRSFSVARRHVSHTEWLDQVRYPESGRRWRVVELTSMPNYSAALALPQGSTVHQLTAQDVGPLLGA